MPDFDSLVYFFSFVIVKIVEIYSVSIEIGNWMEQCKMILDNMPATLHWDLRVLEILTQSLLKI